MALNSLGGANISNWRERPYSVQAFANTKEILKTHPVKQDEKNVMELPAKPQSFDKLSISLGDGSTVSMEEFLKQTDTDGIVILKDGEMIFENYDNDNKADTPHIIMSATKSVVVLVLGILCEKGTININGLASDYVPEIEKTGYKGATIRQLIDMQVGVKVDDWDHKYRASMDWNPRLEDDKGLGGLYDYLANVSPESDPHGGPLKYLSHNTDLVGWIMERATGKTLAELISDLLWKPIGAASQGYMTVDSKDSPRAAGGLCVTVRDLARLGQVVLNDGQRDGHQIIPKTWIDDMRHNGNHEAFEKGGWAGMFGPLYKKACYRSAWVVIENEPEMLIAMGIHGQNLFVDFTNRLVIAKTSSQHDLVNFKALGMTHRAVKAIQQNLSS